MTGPKVKYFQLQNGTEIVSEVSGSDGEFDSTHIKLKEPMQLFVLPSHMTGQSTPIMMLTEWLPWSADEFIMIAADDIMIATDVTPDMLSFYVDSLVKYARAKANKQTSSTMPEFLQEENTLSGAIAEFTENLEDPEMFGADDDSPELSGAVEEMIETMKKRTLH